MKADSSVETEEECCISICLFLHFIDTNITLNQQLSSAEKKGFDIICEGKGIDTLGSHCSLLLSIH